MQDKKNIASILITCILVVQANAFSLTGVLDVANTLSSSKNFVSGAKQVMLDNTGVVGNMVKVTSSIAKSTQNRYLTNYEEYLIGESISAKILGQYKLSSNQVLTNYINAVGHTVALSSNRPNYYDGLRFILLESKEINAFAIPGGFIMITTGMLNFLQNEDELAVVLGHEIAHLELEHGILTIQKESNMEVMGAMKDTVIDATTDGSMTGLITDKLLDNLFESILNGYSVNVETEADKRGIQLAGISGYRPKFFLNVLNRFKNKAGHYGGANYPKERAKDAKKFVRRYRHHLSRKTKNAFAVRTERFKRAINESN